MSLLLWTISPTCSTVHAPPSRSVVHIPVLGEVPDVTGWHGCQSHILVQLFAHFKDSVECQTFHTCRALAGPYRCNRSPFIFFDLLLWLCVVVEGPLCISQLNVLLWRWVFLNIHGPQTDSHITTWKAINIELTFPRPQFCKKFLREISWQWLVESLWNLVHIFKVPRGWITMTLVISRLFI